MGSVPLTRDLMQYLMVLVAATLHGDGMVSTGWGSPGTASPSLATKAPLRVAMVLYLT